MTERITIVSFGIKLESVSLQKNRFLKGQRQWMAAMQWKLSSIIYEMPSIVPSTRLQELELNQNLILEMLPKNKKENTNNTIKLV